ncbi:MAG: hypothetical protein K0U60_07265 [Actinomycetia bacterium]|nr:hypothetical protein [Actinomycetes bacterium]MCH9801346.1 hypothetical protein [Actinomycetes bacterium]
MCATERTDKAPRIVLRSGADDATAWTAVAILQDHGYSVTLDRAGLPPTPRTPMPVRFALGVDRVLAAATPGSESEGTASGPTAIAGGFPSGPFVLVTLGAAAAPPEMGSAIRAEIGIEFDGLPEGRPPAAARLVAARAPAAGYRVTAALPGWKSATTIAADASPTAYTAAEQSLLATRRAANDVAIILPTLLADAVTPVDHHPLVTPSTGSANGFATRLLTADFRSFARRVIRKALPITDEYWSVAVLPGDWRTANFGEASVLPNPRTGFLADPFLFAHDGRMMLYVEEYEWETGRARISAVEYRDGNFGELQPVITEPFHMSFPFVFEYNGRLFMTPECSASGELRLYECMGFPYEWRFRATLLKGDKFVDPVILSQDGRWYLLVGKADVTGEVNSRLYLYQADDPIAGTWHPVQRQPVVADARRARNGGLLREGNDWIRIGQEHGFGRYGNAATLNRILHIGPTGYQESQIGRIRPTWQPWLSGVHHLSGAAGHLAFDFRRTARTGR